MVKVEKRPFHRIHRGKACRRSRRGPGRDQPLLRVNADADRWRGSQERPAGRECISISGLMSHKLCTTGGALRC